MVVLYPNFFKAHLGAFHCAKGFLFSKFLLRQTSLCKVAVATFDRQWFHQEFFDENSEDWPGDVFDYYEYQDLTVVIFVFSCPKKQRKINV